MGSFASSMGGCVASEKETDGPTNVVPKDPAPVPPRKFGTDISVNAKKQKSLNGLYNEVFKVGQNPVGNKAAATTAALRPARLAAQSISSKRQPPPPDSPADNSNPQLVKSYTREILASYRAVEARFVPGRYLENGTQEKLSVRGRCVVVNWISEAHRKFKLKQQTLFIAVSVFDRFLAVRSVAKAKLQLVGACALFVAAKWEELHPPRVRDFVHMAGKDVFSGSDLVKMEVAMLNALTFDVGVPTPFSFIQHLLLKESDAQTAQLTWYLAEASLYDYDLQQYKASIIAGSCAMLAVQMIGRDSEGVQRVTASSGYTEASL